MADLKGEVAARNEEFGKAFTAGDLDALSKLYTEDAYIMPTGADTVKGREAAKTIFASCKSSGAHSVTLSSVEVGDAGGGVIYERGSYHFKKEDGSDFQLGKYVVLWKRIDGRLLMYTDIFNPNS